jgi:hypothetical protein
MSSFSDYIVYVDESGDHSLVSIDQNYPVFVLAFCIFHKQYYSQNVVPAIQQLKFDYFGHDLVVLHEHEIRKEKAPFNIFKSREERELFLEKLTAIVSSSHFVLTAVVIEKQQLSQRYSEPSNPYHLALAFGLERVYRFLKEKGQESRQTHVVVECRGSKEDAELELEFRRVCDGANWFRKPLPFDIKFADKKVNSAGLQLADLVARPVGIHALRPEQTNRAFDVLKEKFYCKGGRCATGEGYEGWGLKRFP